MIPVFAGLYPGRAAILVVFCGSALSALALDRLMARQLPKPSSLIKVILAITFLCLVVIGGYTLAYRSDVTRTATYLLPYIGLALLSLLISAGLIIARVCGILRPTVFGGLAFIFLIADLYIMSYGYNTISNIDDFYPESAIVDYLKSDPEPFRIVTPAEGIVFYPNSSLFAGIGNASGYEPGLPRRHVNFYNAIEGESAIRFDRILMLQRGLESPLLDILNVKYITTINDWWQESSTEDVSQRIATRWLEVGPDAAVAQSFRATDAGLHRIDLRLGKIGNPQGEVIVRVLSIDGGIEFAHATLDVSSLPAESWQPFYFGVFPSEWGREFQFSITYVGDGGLRVGAADNDVYGGGTRLEEGEVTGDDLAFATYFLPRPELAFEDGKTRIYLNDGYFPRAYAVHRVEQADSPDEALEAVLANAEDLDKVVILEQSEDALLLNDWTNQGESFEGSMVTVTEDGLNEVTLVATMVAPGYVVLADSFYPGWQATVDGDKASVYQANYLLRAVYVPEGRHTINFVFRPFDFFAGALISGMTFLLIVALLLFIGWRTWRE
jgi:hypothetical protein